MRFIVHEGRPSWHQARAGHISAAQTVCTNKTEAERLLAALRKHHPKEHFWLQTVEDAK